MNLGRRSAHKKISLNPTHLPGFSICCQRIIVKTFYPALLYTCYAIWHVASRVACYLGSLQMPQRGKRVTTYLSRSDAIYTLVFLNFHTLLFDDKWQPGRHICAVFSLRLKINNYNKSNLFYYLLKINVYIPLHFINIYL